MSNTIASDELPPPYRETIEVDGNQPPTDQSSDVKIFTISLSGDNCLRLIGFPPGVPNLISTSMAAALYELQSATVKCDGTLEYSVIGKPWSLTRQCDEGIRSRKLITAILSNFACNGWNYLHAAEISKRSDGKDVLFFQNGSADINVHVFAVAFSRLDIIRLIGANQEFVDLMAKCITTEWPQGVQQVHRSFYGSFQFKLRGLPWLPRFQSADKCRLFASIITEFRKKGYKLYASLNLTGKDREMQTWFLRKVTDVYF